MNKKNIAIAMSGLTVLASAAPVFAADVKAEYITVQKDYKDTLKKIQAGIKDGSITNLVVTYDKDKEVANYNYKTNATTADAKEVAATTLYNLVDSKLDNLGDGDLVSFNIKYDAAEKFHTKDEMDALKTRLENKEIVKPASETTAGLVMADGVTNSKKQIKVYMLKM
ncbi:hypothetical protein ACD491_17510 [Clostridioides difficile]|uniref:hypothetical protein n=1 Tax=Clostridioides difficile TaxID=1496 RepID=UPI003557365E